MLDTIQATLQPVIVETLATLVLAAIAWLMRKLPEQMRMQIEARHRDALHSALETGVGYAFDALEAALRTNPTVAAGDAAIGTVLDYVQRSVPDAIKRLGPSQAMLQAMARAKINEALARAGLDPLTSALQAAGAPAVQP